MGGFDPDVLGWWRDDHGPGEDGRGVAFVQATPGSWRVDVYAHVGSMNGRHFLSEAGERPGAFFRRCHPGRAFPAWLARMLDCSGEDDPGHEESWRDTRRAVKEGAIEIDASSGSVVGFLVHLTPFSGSMPDAPEGDWFDAACGRRVPSVFPIGLASAAPDPDIDSFLDGAFGRERPAAPMPIATSLVPIIATWPGDPLARLDGGAEITLALADAYHLYWIAALGSDSTPHFEFVVGRCGDWKPPDSSASFAVVARGDSTWAIGPPPHARGWFAWWAVRDAARALDGLPDGASLELAMLRIADGGDETDEAIGRARYAGSVKAGAWHVEDASPAVARATLAEALAFASELATRRSLTLRNAAERIAFEAVATIYATDDADLVRDGDLMTFTEGDDRTMLMTAAPVFRTRLAGAWPMDPIDEIDDEDPDDD
jgi:hypothetical protein